MSLQEEEPRTNTHYFAEINCKIHLIDTPEQVIVSLERLRLFSTLAIDCEGVDLGSFAPTSTLSVLHMSTGRDSDVYCFDIFTLGAEAFSTTTPDGYSLKTLLESSDKRKLLWDLRSDTSALYRHYNITINGLCDVQVLDSASQFLKQVKFPYDRRRALRNVYGLGGTLEKMSFNGVSLVERNRLRIVKAEAKMLFSPGDGGSYEIWNHRPLSPLLLEYCCDTRYFFSLLKHYDTVIRACLRNISYEAFDFSQIALSQAYQRRIAHAISPDFDKTDREIMCRVDQQLLLDLCEIIDIHPADMKVPIFDTEESIEDSGSSTNKDPSEGNPLTTDDTSVSAAEGADSFGGIHSGSFGS
jgi:exonuclease 3'-5' domain-containing protein 1